MNRYEAAMQYHADGYNCAQSVMLAFEDLTKMPREAALAVTAGFGGGIGATHQELCGAASGAVAVLGMLYPYTDSTRPEDKKRVYGYAKEFLTRFEARFDGICRCDDLLKAKLEVTEERTPAAFRSGVKKHCDIMIVTAIEIVEEMLAEQN